MLGSGADIKAGFLFLASAHANIYFDNYYHFSYVTMESLRSMLGYWLAPACLGLLLMAWDRKLYQSLLICGFCLVGILFVLPLDTCPKYLLPHLAIASLGVAYALNRLLSGEKGMRVLGAALGTICLLAPLLVTPVFHGTALAPCSLQYGQLARIGDLRLLSIGTGRVLGTHDGSRLSSGYLFLPPMVDLIKKNYSRIKKEIGRHIETSGSRACFGNSANWLARALIMYELTNRGYRPREPGIWTQPGRDEVVILKELINAPAMAALCPDKDTYYVDHRELTGPGT
jgi:hypothetical protein